MILIIQIYKTWTEIIRTNGSINLRCSSEFAIRKQYRRIYNPFACKLVMCFFTSSSEFAIRKQTIKDGYMETMETD